jgi:hypothetical protein
MSPPRNYLGLATSAHDSALAVVDSAGQIVFAQATERHLQLKRAFNIVPDTLEHTHEVISKYCDPNAELVACFSWSQQNTQEHGRAVRGLNSTVRDNAASMPAFMYESQVASLFALRSPAWGFLPAKRWNMSWSGRRIRAGARFRAGATTTIRPMPRPPA